MSSNQLRVFTYWEGRSGPVQDLCHRSIDRLYGDSHIHLTPENVCEFVGDVPAHVLSAPHAAQRADYFRVVLLARFGGLWLDSDILMLRDVFETVGDAPKFWKPVGEWREIGVSAIYAPFPQHPVFVQALEGMRVSRRVRGYTWGMKHIGAAYRRHRQACDRGKACDFFTVPESRWHELWESPAALDAQWAIGLHLWWSRAVDDPRIVALRSVEHLRAAFPDSVLAEWTRRL